MDKLKPKMTKLKGVLMNNAKNIFICIGVFLVVLFLLARTGTDGTEERRRTDRTLGNIKAEQSIVGVEVGRIEDASIIIGESVSNAQREVSESRKSATTIASGIEQIKLTLAECQRLADENARIIDRVDRAN